MKNEFTSIIERDGDRYIAYCPEVPGANGQGHTKDEARKNLAAAITLILDDRREGGSHSLWCNSNTGAVEAVPLDAEIPDRLATTILSNLSVPEIGD